MRNKASSKDPNGSHLDFSSNDEYSENMDDPQSCDTPQNKKVGKWTQEEDDLLSKYVPLYGEKQWRKISSHIQGRSSIQCLHRWTKILKPGLVKGPWTAEEDQKLISWVKREGPTKWAQASNFIVGRSGKQCRERWFNNLNPNVKKGNWNKEEDELIFELYQKHGSSWSKIAKLIPGRTENAIKNRFYSTLRKLEADKKKIKQEPVHEEFVQNEETEELVNLQPPRSPTGLECPGALSQANTLYRLLQEKKGDISDKLLIKENSFREEKEVQDGSDRKKEKQEATFTVEKSVVRRNTKPLVMPEEAAKSLNSDFDDNDLNFEKFLLAVDSTIGEDFIMREFEEKKESGELGELDGLQHKILNYCQENIRNLADTFKTISNNPLDSLTSSNMIQENRSKVGEDIIQNSNLFLNKNEGILPPPQIYQQNIGGINISTPIPVTHIQGKRNSIKKEVEHSPSFPMKKSPLSQINQNIQMEPFSFQRKVEDQSGQNGKGYEEEPMDLLWNEETLKAHEESANQLLDITNSIENRSAYEGEKRMTFLFQQLSSLEDLLKNAKNELMKIENSVHKDKEKEFEVEFSSDMNKENVLHKGLYEKDLWDQDEGIEKIVKKRKYA